MRGLTFTRTSNIDTVWHVLVEIYAEVWEARMHEIHYSAERYGERLARHASEPGWEVLLGYDGREVAGYVYGSTVRSDSRWWSRMSPSPAPQYIDVPSFAFKEGMLRPRWRSLGLARWGHDQLLATRPEKQSVLLVNPRANSGKIMRRYEDWGYRKIGMQQPAPDGPILTAMIRSVNRD
ncbi:GNAT family N-acetyltransferase [Streptomyces chumphonensis]|uniref:GNAT family N-acetyltransferase n=1 Tax=Streptomyces chumphonensis TaxID=1214925 RepID=UPI003D735876